MDGNLMQEVLQAVNAGATSLNSNTLANVNAMNVELHNADGSLAGKYTLSNFLENVIYQFLATTKASALASVLGGIFPGVVVTKNKNSTTDLNNFSLGCTITILPNVSEVPNGVNIGQAGFCISFSWSSNRCLQVIIVNDATKQIYVRSYRDDSGWTSWK